MNESEMVPGLLVVWSEQPVLASSHPSCQNLKGHVLRSQSEVRTLAAPFHRCGLKALLPLLGPLLVLLLHTLHRGHILLSLTGLGWWILLHLAESWRFTNWSCWQLGFLH